MGMNQMISVIVPIYNTEEFLPMCIESILHQTYRDLELILVDDGSTDNSGKICDQYSEKYPQVRTIHINNGGLIRARKIGVSIAQGNYIGFVDSDDWIESIMYERLYQLIEEHNADIACANLVTTRGTIMKNELEPGVYSGKDLEKVFKCMVFDFTKSKPGILQSSCTKLYKKTILSKIIVSIDERITHGEDAATVYNYCMNSNTIVLTDELLYHYRTRSGSTSSSGSVDLFEKVFYFSEYMKAEFSRYKEEYQLQKQLKMYIMPFFQLGLKSLFGINLHNKYVLNEDICSSDSKILLYGAGTVGQSYVKQINPNNIAHWVDKAHSGETINGVKIENVIVVKDNDYDKIIIAILDENLARNIENELISMGVEKEKIIWVKPRIVSEERVIDL